MERIGEVGDELAKKLQIYLELKPRQFSGHELRQIQPFFQADYRLCPVLYHVAVTQDLLAQWVI